MPDETNNGGEEHPVYVELDEVVDLGDPETAEVSMEVPEDEAMPETLEDVLHSAAAGLVDKTTGAFSDMLSAFSRALLENPRRRADQSAVDAMNARIGILATSWKNAVLAQAEGDRERAARLLSNIESIFIDYQEITKAVAFREAKKFWETLKVALMDALDALLRFGVQELAGRVSPGLAAALEKHMR